MSLHKVPGSKNYFADPAGFRVLLSGSKMQAAAVSAADSLARAGGENYTAGPATVHAGWANEARAGAVVREVTPDGRDARRRLLLTTAAAMGRRARG